MALRTRHMGVLKFPGTILMACRHKGSRVTWRLAVQRKASWTKYTIGVCGWESTGVVTLALFGLTTVQDSGSAQLTTGCVASPSLLP